MATISRTLEDEIRRKQEAYRKLSEKKFDEFLRRVPGLCRDCRWWWRDDRKSYRHSAHGLVTDETSIPSNCNRYPKAVLKYGDESCGEFEKSPQGA